MEKHYAPAKKSIAKRFVCYTVPAAALLLLYHCPFKLLTGIDCPGCGLTRAFACMLLCDPKAAFYYNPVAPLLFAQLAAALCARLVLKKEIPELIVIIAAVINASVLFAVWLVRIM